MTYDWQYEEAKELGLRDCPFCGGACIIQEKGNSHTKKHCVEIKCTKCFVKRQQCILNSTGVLTFEKLKAGMLRDWNKRNGN